VRRPSINHSLAFLLCCITAICCPSLARAEVSDLTSASLTVSLQQEVNTSPAELFADIGKVDKWWNSQHTWSGSAANLSLPLQAGACFCERWDGGSTQHGQVIFVKRDAMVRLQASLGPLQELAVNGILTFSLASRDGKTLLKLGYRVNGGPHSGLDKWAGPVEAMLTEQMHRLASFAEKGAPE
jgi:uncharacterized protein YndB with AHSA1/START domain